LDFNCSFISERDENIQQVFILGAKSADGAGSEPRTSFVVAENAGAVDRQEPVVDSPPDGMQISAGEGMQITPGEGMQIGPGEVMQITPGAGMHIGPPGAEGMVISPPVRLRGKLSKVSPEFGR